MDVFDPDLKQKIREAGVIAVLVLEKVEHAVPVAESLLEGGITAMELTLRTPVALDCLKAIKQQVPSMMVGAGTVLTPDQAKEVSDSGADFAVAPGCNPEVIRTARSHHLSFAPGIATPSDIEQALVLGCRLLKFFPAENMGGLSYLRSMAAPYLHLGVEFIPLGGMKLANMPDYLGDPLIAAVGGSWLAPKNEISAGNWPEITNIAHAASSRLKEIRKKE